VPVSGADWTGGGLVQDAVGKVFFSVGTKNYVCSASVVTDTVASRSIAVTAAHCVYDNATRAFVTNWLFVPDYDATPDAASCSATRFGCWTASALLVNKSFADQTRFNPTAVLNDYGFAVLGTGGKANAHLDATVGSFPIGYPAAATGDFAHAFGYPAAAPHDGTRLIYCAQTLADDPNMSSLTWRLAPCNLTGGSSGGPWFGGFAGGGGTVTSINSYRYSGVDAIHGPKFGAGTKKVYDAALDAPGNTIVP